ncbi:MAG: SRPBCC family protein [Acidimicrobiales bacterium]|nr:SRPBCC family protein [Acidimicrobiales bacterium]
MLHPLSLEERFYGTDRTFMRQMIEVDLRSSPEQVFSALENLKAYEKWLGFIDVVEELDIGTEVPCWDVTLRAEIGPFSRLKKLRMVRFVSEPYKEIGFVRRESDDKVHSDWNLNVRIESKETNRCTVFLEVTYSGRFWSKPLQGVFNSHVAAAKDLLRASLETTEEK